MKTFMRSTGFVLLARFSGAALCLSQVGSQIVSAEDEELPPLVIHGSAMDLLTQDPVVPAKEGLIDSSHPETSPHETIARDLPVSLTDYGGAGALTQVQGFGRGAGETAVEAMGVPLHLPQGVGFDFSVFPAFLWEGYSFQSGLGSLAADPRATGALVTLRPWTSGKLDRGESALVTRAMVSTTEVGQVSLAASDGDNWAAVLGLSQGALRGPSGSLASRVQWDGGRQALTMHVLATQVEADSIGSTRFPTPEAVQSTSRWIPMLQWDRRRARSAMKASLYFDHVDYRYEDSSSFFGSSEIETQQMGAQLGWTDGNWRWGGHGRWIAYQSGDFRAPREGQFMGQLGRTWRLGDLTADAVGEGSAVSQFGVAPAGSLGFRLQLGPNWAGSLRLRGARRAPSLSDRYYDDAFFEPNPVLKPEQVWTGWVGLERATGDLRPSFAMQVQSYSNAWTSLPVAGGENTIGNGGSAWGATFQHDLRWRWTSLWSYRHAVALSASRVSATGKPFARLAPVRVTGGIQASPESGRWRIGIHGRGASAVVEDGTGNSVPGHLAIDLLGGLKLASWAGGGGADGAGLTLGFELRNLFNKYIELVKYYPLPGRTFELVLQGMF
ncbi:MAG: TonB-dependent receptor [Bdellovibrionales bacterium]|nr:TonB-dependent receptor [Bdellovibrionales bacterium]